MFLAAAIMNTEKFTTEHITDLHRWTPYLLSFRVTRYSGFRFTPGQFARLGLANGDGKTVWRAFSVVSAPYDEHLEFFAAIVTHGEFTGLLEKCHVGSEILVDKSSYGFLTSDRFHDGSDLWLLATGTGLAPFLSILHDPQIWDSYDRIMLVHSVRNAWDLAYRGTMTALREHPLIGEHARKLIYVPVTTRDRTGYALYRRIPALIKSGDLETHTGVRFTHNDSRVMICGNPDMVRDTREQFKTMDYAVLRRENPGQLVLENAF